MIFTPGPKPLSQNLPFFYVTGKMELLSSKFESQIKTLFENSPSNIIATIPLSKGKPIPLVESIRNDKNSKVFEVTKSNRDSIETVIMTYIRGG